MVKYTLLEKLKYKTSKRSLHRNTLEIDGYLPKVAYKKTRRVTTVEFQFSVPDRVSSLAVLSCVCIERTLGRYEPKKSRLLITKLTDPFTSIGIQDWMKHL